ncbi:M20/M25/M40 family metallo-hydrolase [Steroidobacter sp. S1-65]|uniref:M20/M25/M40 family metallo-hydrolase n=1 Tax=Steroidobacter gossypii TaxID=2805490 RepID=A0ABS1WR92_9GAMM|nr:M20/M25/M40 family metallo-hydrolase [Steroidobacter gossypii]MBM0103494.1 M20/M25/M40 family metallo-hydrolase [Steroidobacter gossypii]
MRLASTIVALALAGALPAYSDSASLDAREKALVSHLTAGENASIALLEQIVNVNSGTMNFAGVRKVGDVLRPRFEALGFKVTWVDGAPFQRAGHLVATRPGRGPHVLLIGHIDTVFEPNHPFQRWERVDQNIARGPGAADMKGGIVVGLAALDALRQAKLLDSLQITVVLHGDEEDSGRPLDLARRDLIEAAKAADIAIGLENAADDPKTAVTARRSSTGWVVKVTAKSSHSSQIFSDEVGAGAAYELGRILNGFYEQVRGEEFVTFNPGLVASSTQIDFKGQPLSATLSGKNNIVTPIAIASGDLRTLTMQELEDTRAKMRKVVAASLPQTSATIEFTDSYPPMAPTEGNRKLLSMYDAVSRDLGFGPVTEVNPRNAGAADISFAANHVEMALDGLGLLGGGSHTPEEFADLRTFKIQSQRLAVLLYRLGKK